jgi:hypothetical protein
MVPRRGRRDRDAQRAGRWGGGSAQCAPPSRGRDHNRFTIGTSCRAPAARRARGAGASAGRMQRRRVRAVSARLEAVQKILTNSSQTAMSDRNGRGAMSLPRDRITASTAHDAKIRPHRGNTRVQSPGAPVAARHQHRQPSTTVDQSVPSSNAWAAPAGPPPWVA